MKIMTFHQAGTGYGIELTVVATVVGRGDVVAIPGDAGAIEVDGRRVPLLDPRRWPGEVEIAPPHGQGPGPVLVLREGGRELGIRVGRLGEVVEVAESAVRPVPRYFESMALQGVVDVGGRLVTVVDGAGLMRCAGALPKEEMR